MLFRKYRRFRPELCRLGQQFYLFGVRCGNIVGIAERGIEKLMAGAAHTPYVDLRFGKPVRETLVLGVTITFDNFAGERFHLFGQDRVRINRQAQSVAQRISRRASAARRGLWASAGLRIRPVGADFAIARQAAFFPVVAVASITSNSASSTSSTLRRSASPNPVTSLDLA